VAPRRNEKAARDLYARLFECVGLLDQREGIEDDAVSDDAVHVRVEDARRNQMEDELMGADPDGVPGVVAALVAGDDLEVVGDDVDDLALAFIAPVDAHDCEILPVIVHGHRSVCGTRAGFPGALGRRPRSGELLQGRLAPGWTRASTVFC